MAAVDDPQRLTAGILEEARRADAAAAQRLARFQQRFALRQMFAAQNRQLIAAAGAAARVLEVGSGVGTFLVDAVTAPSIGRLTGLEVGLTSASVARQVTGGAVAMVVAPAERLPFKSDAFNAVIARGVLHHLSAPDAAIREIHRVLAPGGRLVIFEGNPASHFRRFALGFADLLRIRHEDTQYRHLQPQEIRTLLGGFSDVRVEPVNGLFAPFAYVGFGGPLVWRLFGGVRALVTRLYPSGFSWWLLWTAVK